MKLSDFPEYQTAVIASVAGDLESARTAYEFLVEQAEADDDTIAIAYLLQALGNIEARDGNIELGHELHLRAIGQSVGIPLSIISYARALTQHFGDSELALVKLNEADALISSDFWDRKRDNIPLDSYKKMIEEVRSEIEG